MDLSCGCTGGKDTTTEKQEKVRSDQLAAKCAVTEKG